MPTNKFDDLFDSDYYRDLAESHLAELEPEERERWVNHPATQALLKTLMGDYLQYHEAWENEQFVAPTADGTAQMNAKYLGSLEAIRAVAKYIEDIPYDQSEGF